MLFFFFSVLSSSLASKLLRRLIRWWLLSFMVSAPLVGLVLFVERTIVKSNIKIGDPPAQRWYHTGTLDIREECCFLTNILLGVRNVRLLLCLELNSNLR
jgi:hypothetical protein